MSDISSALQSQIQAAYLAGTPVSISGGGSKSLAHDLADDLGWAALDVSLHRGIIEYDPSELVVVVRAGTPLKELTDRLAEKNQILGFEPPFAQRGATVGGMVAMGLAGSARPYRGAVRDYVLGVKIINGKGEILQFGGSVMKNVAGFDFFRLMVGAMGTLGVLLEVSLRLIPKPLAEVAVQLECKDAQRAIKLMNQWAKSCTSLSAAHWFEGAHTLRFSGTQQAVDYDLAQMQNVAPGELSQFAAIDERAHAFFTDPTSIYQCALPPATAPLGTAAVQLIDWGGARRFIKTPGDIERIQRQVSELGGRCAPLQDNKLEPPFATVPQALKPLHQQLKRAFDPAGILNRQWMIEAG